MTESFIPTSEFETASNAVNNILGQPVEEIEITDILPPLNDVTDSNKVFKGKLSVLFVDMRKSTDLTDELKSKKMVKVYRSFIRIVIQAIRYSGGYTRQFAGDGIMGVFQDSNKDDQIISSSYKATKAARYIHTLIDYCLNPALKKSMDICIGCGIGICTGTIMITKAGMPSQSNAKKFFDGLGISSESLTEIIVNQHNKALSLDKADFAHEMAIWAVMASDSWKKSGANIIENFNLLASAKGDIYIVSFGDDDKKADVDAENIYDRMINSSEDLFSTILNYIRDKQANNINPQVEYISRYGDGSVVEGWNYLVDEFNKMGLGSAYLASDDPSYQKSKMPGPIKFIISLFREGMYVNAMIESGAALQGEETWNEVRELGPQTVLSDRREEIADTLADFLDYLYREGDLAQYGIEKYSAP